MFRLLRAPMIRDVFGPAIAMFVIVLFGNFVNTFAQYLLALVVIAALVGAALVMIVGYTRVIMLATAAMMAIGAYTSALLILHFNLPYLLTLPLAWIMGAISGIVLAVPATRFRGHHLAMATMVFQFLVIIGLREWADVTGGPLGLRVPPTVVFGVQISSDIVWLLLIAAAGAVAIALIGVLLTGRFGKTLRAISSSELAADAFGINIPRFHIAAFAISSGFLSYAGALFGPRARIIDPDSFGIIQSVIALGYPIIGGLSNIWGGVFGGAILNLLPEAFRALGKYQQLLVALLVVIVMVVWPSGILGLFSRFSRPARSTALPNISAAAKSRAQVEASAPPPEAGDGIPAIQIEGVTKQYGALTAVDNVSLIVQPREIHGLIGPNGAGKTTLFNAASGFVRSDAGTVRIFGQAVQDKPSRSRIAQGVTRTFQNVAVFRELSCLDNVIIGIGDNRIGQAVGASAHELVASGKHAHTVARAWEALDEVGIADLALRPAGSLSLGNQRLLEIARAIVSRPRVMLLDEPISGVSREDEGRVGELLKRLNKQHGITMLLVEHNIAFVLATCERMSVMATGRIVAQGDPNTVIRQAEVRRHYFGEASVSAA